MRAGGWGVCKFALQGHEIHNLTRRCLSILLRAAHPPCPHFSSPSFVIQQESWEDEDEEEEEEDASSEDEERHALWDPSLATPARGLKARKLAAAGGEGRAQRRRRSSTTSGSGGLLPEEQAVLAHLNEQLQRQGKEPVTKPTVRAGADAQGCSEVAGRTGDAPVSAASLSIALSAAACSLGPAACPGNS